MLLRCLVLALACLLSACAGLPLSPASPYVPAIAASTSNELGRLAAPFGSSPEGLSGARVLAQGAFALERAARS
jgi:hypothetical protein